MLPFSGCPTDTGLFKSRTTRAFTFFDDFWSSASFFHLIYRGLWVCTEAHL